MKDKLLNYTILFLIFFFTVSLFSNNNKNQTVIDEKIKITTEKSYTVPASVKLTVKNNTSTWFIFDTCKNVQITKDTKVITSDKCEVVNLKSSESKVLDFSSKYLSFDELWNYQVVLEKDALKATSSFDIEHKGLISKIFIFIFYAPIYNLMAFLLEITNYSLGWAIIIVTVIIRLLLLFPQHKMMVSQKKMQLIQPKIKEVQDKYKDDKQKLWMELMNLYKEEWVNPMWSCWMLLIQMPILLVIYNVIVWIQSTSNNYYLYSFLSDYNLTNISSIFFWVDLFKIWWLNWLILSLIVAVLQYIQVKLSLSYNKTNSTNVVLEKKKDWNWYENFMPDPELMNKFMLYWMPVMIWFATYTFFAWVGLYWWIWTIFMIVQQIIVNKILKK